MSNETEDNADQTPIAALNTSTQSPELTAFYRAYADWLDAGAKEREPFSRWYECYLNPLRIQWVRDHVQ